MFILSIVIMVQACLDIASAETHPSQSNGQIFYDESAHNILQKSGIAELIPGTMIDDYLFDPCGYSMNGLLRNVSKPPWYWEIWLPHTCWMH